MTEDSESNGGEVREPAEVNISHAAGQAIPGSLPGPSNMMADKREIVHFLIHNATPKELWDLLEEVKLELEKRGLLVTRHDFDVEGG